MSLFPPRGLFVALPVLGLTGLLLAGCVAPAGGVDDGVTAAYGADYYQPFAADAGGDFGGWGPGYRVGPFHGDEHFSHFGFGHHAFAPVSGFHGVPSLPHGGAHIHVGGHGGRR